jgi:DNA-directed RNA polymerase specialized sigma24 family protein
MPAQSSAIGYYSKSARASWARAWFEPHLEKPYTRDIPAVAAAAEAVDAHIFPILPAFLHAHFCRDWRDYLGEGYLIAIERVLARRAKRGEVTDPRFALSCLEMAISDRGRRGLGWKPARTNFHRDGNDHPADVADTASREEDPADLAAASERARVVRQILAAMPADARHLLSRVCIEEEIVSDIASEYGIGKTGLDHRLKVAKKAFAKAFKDAGHKAADFLEIDESLLDDIRTGHGSGMKAKIDRQLAKDARAIAVEHTQRDWTICYHEQEDGPFTAFTFEASSLNNAPISIQITDARGTPSTITLKPSARKTIVAPDGIRKIEARATQPRQRLSVNRLAA